MLWRFNRLWVGLVSLLAVMAASDPASAHERQVRHGYGYSRDNGYYDPYDAHAAADSRLYYDHYRRDQHRSFDHQNHDLYDYGTTNPYSSRRYFEDQARGFGHYLQDQHERYDHYRRDQGHGHGQYPY